MRISQNGINLIKRYEGCKLVAYKCAAGIPTIGYGHTAGVKMGQKITQAEADSYLKEDIVKYEAKVMKYYDKYKFNQNEFDALVSFAYNIGSIDQLTAGGTRSRKVIAEKMLSYCKAAGKVNVGLQKRRKEERKLFCKNCSALSDNVNTDNNAAKANNGALTHYKVKITAKKLNVRKGPDTAHDIVTQVSQNEVYTIVEEKKVGSTAWGKLKSGVGYISLAYTKKI